MTGGHGLLHYWSQGDAVTQSVAVLLLAMSVASWTVIVRRSLAALHAARSTPAALDAFWSAPDADRAIDALARLDRSRVFAGVAVDAISAARAWQTGDTGVGGSVGADEFIGRALQQSVLGAQVRIERGQTLLASVGSTAPFVGLFGTVWGILQALVGLSGEAHATLDRVAGPVGEALVMTAAGLFVAIPAVLAYNALARANRISLERLEGFGRALQAWTSMSAGSTARSGPG
jgi:biopolymer transport protein ExbB